MYRVSNSIKIKQREFYEETFQLLIHKINHETFDDFRNMSLPTYFMTKYFDNSLKFCNYDNFHICSKKNHSKLTIFQTNP